MVGGIVYITFVLMTWLCTPNNCPISLDFDYIYSAFFGLLMLGALAAIAALHVLQPKSYGSAAAFAALLAFVGVVMMFVEPLRSLIPYAEEYFLLFLIGFAVATVGVIAYGVVTTRASVVPWWCGAALIAGSPLASAFLYLFSPVEG